MFRAIAATFLIALLLTGCAGMRLVDADVRSFAAASPIAANSAYRFERLPSQQADAAQQTRLEALAQQALSKAGLHRNDTGAQYSVAVSVSTKVDSHSPWNPSTDHAGWGGNLGWGVPRGNVQLRGHPLLPLFGPIELPYYWRQVSLIIRHLGTAQVVFETQAANDGPWSDGEAVVAAMFEAALKDFPNPPPGVRRINIEIPR